MSLGNLSTDSELRTLRSLFFELAESVAEDQSDDPAEWGRGRPEGVRALLHGEVARYRRARLSEAQEEYVRAITSLRNRKTLLPEAEEARMGLLSSVFGAYPQVHQAFLTVQHREFKQMSPKDVESFLRQLQALGVLPEDASQWRAEDVVEAAKKAKEQADIDSKSKASAQQEDGEENSREEK